MAGGLAAACAAEHRGLAIDANARHAHAARPALAFPRAALRCAAAGHRRPGI